MKCPHYLTMLIVYRCNNKSCYGQLLSEGSKCMVQDKAMKKYITESLFDSNSDPILMINQNNYFLWIFSYSLLA